jgi:fluoride ion exporter CrcB/FEX
VKRFSKAALTCLAIGGGLGSLARFQIDQLVNRDWLSILIINAIGCVLIGMLAKVLSTELIRAAVVTGFLGAFTSMSQVIAIASIDLSQNLGFSLLAATVLIAVGAVALGSKIGLQLTK